MAAVAPLTFATGPCMAGASSSPPTLVKNTFIDFPATPTGIPTPLASAPAHCAFSLKESLARAVGEMPPSTEEGSVIVRRTRMKPSMISIPESLAAHNATTAVEIRKDGATYIAGTPAHTSTTVSTTSVPATPVPVTPMMGTPIATPMGMWEMMQTPTTPMTISRTTLSLVDMVAMPSPSVEQRALAQQQPRPTYQIMYQGMPMVAAQQLPGQPMPAPPQMATTTVVQGAPVAAPLAAPVAAPVAAPMTAPMAAPVAAPSKPPETAPTTVIMQPASVAHIPPPPTAAPVVVSAAADPAEEARATSQALQAAAVQLGLVPQSQAPQTQPYTTGVAVGTIQPHYTTTLQQAPQPTTTIYSMASQPQPQPMSVITTQPQRAVPPPPPVAPAPTVVFTPKASSVQMMPAMAFSTAPAAAPAVVSPIVSPVALAAPAAVAAPVLPAAALGAPAAPEVEADIKVLLDMAVASGNQQAVNALLRQAQQGGMSPERFQTLVDSAQK